MGTGKTAIGKELAKKLKLPFWDLDAEIEKNEKSTIPQIFDKFGEEYFRQKERKYLKLLFYRSKFVLSLGGGTICSDEAVRLVKENGTLVFIKTPFELIFERLKRNQKRPLLLDKKGEPLNDYNLNVLITNLYDKRIKWYEKAELIIDVEKNQNPSDVAYHIINQLNR